MLERVTKQVREWVACITTSALALTLAPLSVCAQSPASTQDKGNTTNALMSQDFREVLRVSWANRFVGQDSLKIIYFDASGGDGDISVIAALGQSWTAVSNVDWIVIKSGATGTGNGTVHYTVAANPGFTSRTGTMTINGQTYTVGQAAKGFGGLGSSPEKRRVTNSGANTKPIKRSWMSKYWWTIPVFAGIGGGGYGLYRAMNSSGGILCNDGTISNAKNRQGACSHHGGIRR